MKASRCGAEHSKARARSSPRLRGVSAWRTCVLAVRCPCLNREPRSVRGGGAHRVCPATNTHQLALRRRLVGRHSLPAGVGERAQRGSGRAWPAIVSRASAARDPPAGHACRHTDRRSMTTCGSQPASLLSASLDAVVMKSWRRRRATSLRPLRGARPPGLVWNRSLQQGCVEPVKRSRGVRL